MLCPGCLTLGQQLHSPWLLLSLAVYAALAAAAIWCIASAPRQQRWLALAWMALTAGVCLYRIRDLPPYVVQDTLDAIPWFSGRPFATWDSLFGEYVSSLGIGWNAMPWYVVWRVTHSLLAERIVGTGWLILLVGAVVAQPLINRTQALVTGAVIASMPAGLWLSRHNMGADILLEQYLLLCCLLRAQRRGRWCIPAAVLGIALQLTYVPARISGLYPALALRGRRLIATYAVIVPVVGVIFLLSWGGVMQRPTLHDSSGLDAVHLMRKTGFVLASLGSRDYAEWGAGLFSYPGAQTLPWPVLLLVIVGAVRACWSANGRRLVLLALVGCLPCIASNAHVGWSHRLMMMFVPMAVLAGVAVGELSLRRAEVVALIVAAVGVQRWTSDYFWAPDQPRTEFAYVAEVAKTLDSVPPGTRVRIDPGNAAVGAMLFGRGMSYHALDLKPEDLEQPGPLVIVHMEKWRVWSERRAGAAPAAGAGP